MKSLVVLIAMYAVAVNGYSVKHSKVPMLDGKIVGGKPTNIESFPFIVSLSSSSDFSHYCAGSIYKANVIITAAHCCAGQDKIYIRAGSSTREEGGTILESISIEQHPDYDTYTIQNDCCKINLNSSLVFSDKVQPIELIQTPWKAGKVAIVAGWGTTSSGGILPTQLQYVEVPTVSNEECQGSYGDEIFDNMCCAGYTEGGKDACQGDSGGPLVVDNRLAGIVSWGRGCAKPIYYGVYANVYELLDFLEQ